MRLSLQHPALTERAALRGLFAGERVLAERGITLPMCLQALADEARKEPPTAALHAYYDAEAAALTAAFGRDQAPTEAALVLVLSPGDELPASLHHDCQEGVPC